MKLNKVYQKDVMDFLDELENNSISLAIVDPPYNMKQGEWDTFETEDEYLSFTFKWLDKLLPKMKKDGSLYLFNNAYNSAIILNYLRSKDISFRNWITWYKKDGFCSTKKRYINNQEIILFYTMNGKAMTFNADDIRIPYASTDRINHAKKKGILKNGKRWFPNEDGKLCPDVWEFTSQRHLNMDNGKIQKQDHPTPKPELMIERMIIASSNEHDLILDLFSGTGTTSYIAKKLHRNFVGCELEKKYIDIINERLDSIEGE
jgi:site-specific DNA-methyltransferase (adenine-specific)